MRGCSQESGFDSMLRRGGFTLIEIMIVIFVMSVGLITIISGVNSMHRYISETAQRTIALNLAKEGVEAMYNIRNTNWRRWSSSRDACRLKSDPMVDESNPGCEDDSWIREGWYVASVAKNGANSNNWYYKAIARENYDALLTNDNRPSKKSWDSSYGWWDKAIFNVASFDMPHDSYREKSGIIYFKDGIALTASEILEKNISREELEGASAWYWRNIHVNGLYDKDSGAQIAHCPTGNTRDCGSSDAKELHFCSTVWSIKPYQVMVNICAVMTNFMK